METPAVKTVDPRLIIHNNRSLPKKLNGNLYTLLIFNIKQLVVSIQRKEITIIPVIGKDTSKFTITLRYEVGPERGKRMSPLLCLPKFMDVEIARGDETRVLLTETEDDWRKQKFEATVKKDCRKGEGSLIVDDFFASYHAFIKLCLDAIFDELVKYEDIQFKADVKLSNDVIRMNAPYATSQSHLTKICDAIFERLHLNSETHTCGVSLAFWATIESKQKTAKIWPYLNLYSLESLDEGVKLITAAMIEQQKRKKALDDETKDSEEETTEPQAKKVSKKNPTISKSDYEEYF
jgi:hypothetical protein